jgi:hypothetical protein
MEQYTLAFRLDPDRVRLTLMSGDEELLRASLPPPAQFWTGKPVKALLESLAIWMDAQLRVVLDANDPADGWPLELTDEMGTGNHTLYYDVITVERRRRRSGRVRRLGSFRDMRQLCLIERLAEGGR